MLTRRGAAALSSIVFFALSSSFTNSVPFIIGGLLLLALMAITFTMFTRTVDGLSELELTRNVSTESTLVGEEFSYELVLRNRSSISLGPLVVRDPIPDNLDLLAGGSSLEKIPRWSDHRLRRVVEAVEMGDAAFANVEVRLFDRLGLLWASRIFHPTNIVRIYPSPRTAGRRSKLTRRLVYRYAGPVVWRRKLLSEFAGIREYYPGDDHRLIAWKAMAKSPSYTPMTKELEEEVDVDVLVIIGNRKSMGDGEKGSRKLDRAVEAALTVANEVNRTGHRMSLLFYQQGTPRLISGPPFLLAEQMYNMSLHKDDDLAPLLEAVRLTGKRPRLVILIVDSPYPLTPEAGAFNHLRAPNLMVGVLLLDSLRFFAESGDLGREATWALRLLQDRERVHQEEGARSLAAANFPVTLCGPDNVSELAVEAFWHAKGAAKR